MTTTLIDQLDLDQLDTVTLENGDVIATLNIGSNMLPHVTVDTYQTFSGDSTFEMEATDWVDEKGFDDDEVDLSITDHDAITRELGQVMLDEMTSQLLPWATNHDDRNVVTPGKLTSVYSPRFYNFETDSFAADYEVNLTALSEWLTENEIMADDYGLYTFASGPGFHSFIPGRLESEDERTETLAWLAVHAYLAETLDRDALFMAGAEAEWEIYNEHMTASCHHDVYTDRLDRRVAELLHVAELGDIEEHVAGWAEAAGVDYFGPTPDPWDLMERVEIDAQLILATHTAAQI